MADHRSMNRTISVLKLLFLLLAVACVVSCALTGKGSKPDERLIKEPMPRQSVWKEEAKEPAPEPTPPPFISTPEEIIPFKTKIVNIEVRNSPLSDVLYMIAKTSSLNLMVDRDVPLDLPITLTLRNVTAEEALKTVVANADCFYTIASNVIRIEAIGTRIFELGHPALISTFSMDVGGNISGAGMSGSVRMGSTGDSKSLDFWGSLEASLNSMMDKKDTPAALQGAGDDGKTKLDKKDTPAALQGAGDDEKTKPVFRHTDTKAQQGIVINRLNGTIMATTSRKNLDKIEQYLDTVRKVLDRQVMIEARIIEVQLSDATNYGIDWSFLSNSKVLGTLNAGFGTLNAGQTLLSNATATAASTGQFQVGVTKGNFQGLLTALQTQGDVKTLSNPKIYVMNGHPSVLTVGTNTSFISQVSTTTTATAAGNSITFTPQTSSVLTGMIIGIVPFISENGDISLNITPITSDLLQLTDKTFGTAGNQVTMTIPTVALREMTTTVKMRDGQMVIIGGLISNNESTTKNKIPIIGDIPYLGALLNSTTTSKTRSELVLLLLPRIVENE
jgi:MSHA type pilus biogenesis protein MshL